MNPAVLPRTAPKTTRRAAAMVVRGHPGGWPDENRAMTYPESATATPISPSRHPRAALLRSAAACTASLAERSGSVISARAGRPMKSIRHHWENVIKEAPEVMTTGLPDPACRPSLVRSPCRSWPSSRIAGGRRRRPATADRPAGAAVHILIALSGDAGYGTGRSARKVICEADDERDERDDEVNDRP